MKNRSRQGRRFISRLCALLCAAALFASVAAPILPVAAAPEPPAPTEKMPSPEPVKIRPLLQAAFLRQGQLWIKRGDEEWPVSRKGERVDSASWSCDGAWLAYIKYLKSTEPERVPNREEIWAYRIKTRQYVRISESGEGTRFQWAPSGHAIAWGTDGGLQMRTVDDTSPRRIMDVANGVSNFSWLPDGSGWLASSTAHGLPDGWTNPILFKIPLPPPIVGEKKPVTRFFTIPSQLTKGEVHILSIGTSSFKWSADRQWISFIVSPTASWSMDSNMLCALSADGKTFVAIDEMLTDESWFKWAPRQTKLGYIAGGERIILSSEKDLKVRELPATLQLKLTPEHFADHDFTWQSDELLTVARVKQTEWSNDPAKRPLPTLVQIDLHRQIQKPLATPPQGYGDFSPTALQGGKRLGWVRSSLRKAEAWVCDRDGSHPVRWITNVGGGEPGPYGIGPYGEAVTWYEPPIVRP
jgi:hypothetical protein